MPKDLTLDDYQERTKETSSFQEGDDAGEHLEMTLVSAAGEIGEVLNAYKKFRWHGHRFDPDKIIVELGDALWYIAQAAVALRVPLSEVAQRNLDKLQGRYPQGFAEADSINRKSVLPEEQDPLSLYEKLLQHDAIYEEDGKLVIEYMKLVDEVRRSDEHI